MNTKYITCYDYSLRLCSEHESLLIDTRKRITFILIEFGNMGNMEIGRAQNRIDLLWLARGKVLYYIGFEYDYLFCHILIPL